MKAHIITIGDEILIGQIVDSNSAWMAQQLNLQGIQVAEIISTSDTHDAIINSIKRSFEKVDLVLVTGGLGPTKDDITKKAIADFYGVNLQFSESSYQHIVELFKQGGRTPIEAHRLQCFMPENAQLLTNEMGSAPGMWFEKSGKILVSMPGVPYEMKHLMEEQVIPKIIQFFPRIPIAHRTVLTAGAGESSIAEKLSDFETNLPANVKLAYLPSLSKVRLRLTAIGEDERVIHGILDQKIKELETLLPDLIFGYGDDELEAVLGRLLTEKNKSLGTAESCTGGYLAHRITAISGSSAYFKGSVIAYANEVKQQLLSVKEQTLIDHGAVSEETVIEMVSGALQLLKTDIAISISGIAGPGGGTPEKPVGTIWLAVGDKDGIETKKLQLNKNRLKNIEYTANVALNMIRKFLLAR